MWNRGYLEFTPLNTSPHEARLLRLYPTDDVTEHVRCDFKTFALTNMPLFVAIENARGYRKFLELVEVEGRALFISCALERFLRYLRTKIKTPTRLWVRYACVIQVDPQKQEAYWTRKYSGKMYAMASQVFDMHQINNRLIENGSFERIIDLRFAEWKKGW
ncbi:uncharacterized protein EKO05_0007934 [Ascochyta rabiei]|uniref:uncharacterized protein n=1 Tax=Didymella rabiei TaxID=5454 RepID=UPI0022078F13|nr:uncharacterized protein EKO05_0007934 [Ascochyta rabiei]UPX17590.1 hypothetical protein EKO05_0007934 [Ascochyta rabiei]